MAELRSELKWFLSLTNEEFLLILKSLRGATRDHEIEAALELSNKLSYDRVAALRRTADQVERAMLFEHPHGKEDN